MDSRSPAPNAVQKDKWGFFLSSDLWTEEMVSGLAAICGIAELTPRHWQVIRFARAHWESAGTKPTVYLLGKASGVPARELYRLFPGSPALAVARIAGIPKLYLCHNPGPHTAVPAIPRKAKTATVVPARRRAPWSRREAIAVKRASPLH